MDNDIVTPNEVAKYLRITRQTVLVMLRRGDLKGFRVGRRGDWKIKKRDVFALIGEK